MNEFSTVAEFLDALAATGSEYLLIGKPQPEQVRFLFTGPFEGTTLIWDASIEAQGGRSPAKQYLDVAGSGYPLRRIRIGLHVDRIDMAVLLRTIIMIRKYKRLHIGRHEFGPDLAPGAG